MIRIVTVSSMLLVVSCQGATEDWHRIQMDIFVESDPGVPLSGVPVELSGHGVQRTSAAGTIETNLTARVGELVTLSPRCPAGFIGEAPRTIRVRRLRHSADLERLRVRLRCRPESRVAVFLVRALGDGPIDIFVDGEWAANTDSDGVAHLSRRAAAGTELHLELRSRGPNVRPERISRMFTMPDSDEIFVVDQSFRSPVSRRRPPRSRPRIIRIE
jgi:hypothetical protein